MGDRAKGIQISEGRDGLDSYQAHYVGIGPQKNSGSAKGKVGEGEGAAEEGGIRVREPAAASLWQAFVRVVNRSIVLSFAKIPSVSRINSLRNFLRTAFCYEFDPCSTFCASGSVSPFACFDLARLY
jgi:hypothetical protein